MFCVAMKFCDDFLIQKRSPSQPHLLLSPKQYTKDNLATSTSSKVNATSFAFPPPPPAGMGGGANAGGNGLIHSAPVNIESNGNLPTSTTVANIPGKESVWDPLSGKEGRRAIKDFLLWANGHGSVVGLQVELSAAVFCTR